MCSQQQVDNTAACYDQLFMTTACPTRLCMLYRHRVFILLKFFHDPSWGLIVNDIFYLILSLHEILHVDRRMKIMGTELLHMKF